MKRTTFLLLLFFNFFAGFSQSPGIQWQQTLGGSNYDAAEFSLKTIDNGIILVGQTYSTAGNFAANHGSGDLWIEKFNLQGISQWRKLLGGTGTEKPVSYVYNSDGTILILSTTTSTNGDITNNHGAVDIWICKLDNNGNVLWQKCFGGSLDDYAWNIIKGNNGNYIVTGATLSNNGDVTANNGIIDVWVFKINETGTLIWQKNLGGTGQEGFNMVKAVESADGSIYLLTETGSNNGDVAGNHGSINTRDMWLVKLNSSGIIQWQKCYGGTASEIGTDIKLSPAGEVYILGYANSTSLPSFHGINNDYSDFYFCRVSPAGALLSEKCFGGTLSDEASQIVSIESDGSFVLSGYVNNGGGDIVGYHGTASGSDIWVLKINLAGSILWQKTLGGFSSDYINGQASQGELFTGSVVKTGDQGYLITAYTESSDGDITGFHQYLPNDSSRADLWAVKLSATGQLEWQRSLGGSRDDLPKGSAVEIGTNDFIITGATKSANGDIITNYGNWDAWLIRLGSVSRIKGTVFIDQNSNGIKDAADPLYSDVLIEVRKGANVRTTIPYAGSFLVESDTGTYNTSLSLTFPYYTIVPVSRTSSFTTYFNTDSFSFALQPIPGNKNLMINTVPVTPARPGFDLVYKIFYRNAGTTSVPAGEILFKKDTRLNLVSSVPAISSSNGDTLKWSYTNLNPQDTASITLNMRVAAPPTANIGDTLSSVAVITPVAGDLTPADDTSIIRQVVIGSFDPNDKTENFSGRISQQQVSSAFYINYLIRFQNTGNDTAFNIVVRDTLDTKLDWNSLQMVAASHPYQLQINSQNILAWSFNNIKLVDSVRNEPGSHGFIAYRIKPKANLNMGDTIKNTASIYFDFNLPVSTNRQTTVVVNNVVTGINDVNNISYAMLLFPNPSTDQIWIEVKERVIGNATLTIQDITGRRIYREQLGRINLNSFRKAISFGKMTKGYYTIQLLVGNKRYVQKLVIQ